eukprot:7467500-Lingulodinium_polyedra.AAC.1
MVGERDAALKALAECQAALAKQEQRTNEAIAALEERTAAFQIEVVALRRATLEAEERANQLAVASTT